MKSSYQTTLSTISTLFSLLPLTLSSPSNSTFPKRGLCYIATSHSESDSSLFTLPNSPLTWYYNYSPWPGPGTSLSNWNAEFVPMIHSVSDAAASIDTVKGTLNGSIASGNHITHLLTFNEPDGDTSSGGTNSDPQTAAQVFIDSIAPLRQPPYNLKISLPATTGSPRGLQWLHDFNSSCYQLNKKSGCEVDFIAAHWYGDFGGLSTWLGQLHALYPSNPLWVTEFAIPSVSDDETLAFLNQSLPFLDEASFVERYAWFGSFRSNDANEWTGDSVSVLDKNGELTQLGAEWLGGEKDGFKEGENASANGAVGRRWNSSLLVLVVVAIFMQLIC